MNQLPTLMVAPNGARRTTADHLALPVTIAQIVECAKTCFAAGAEAIHAHVRDENQRHVLDAGLYRELIGEMTVKVPDMAVQITTEAVGRYSPAEQRAVVRDVMPKMVSVALAERARDDDPAQVRKFYHWTAEAGIAVQHIVYSPEELTELARLLDDGVIPAGKLQILFVLGRYARDQQSDPADLRPFLDVLKVAPEVGSQAQWAACAFGRAETACLRRALDLGGAVRVGFENNLYNADGGLARDNAERVAEIKALITDGKWD